jgi:hypothetical protein
LTVSAVVSPRIAADNAPRTPPRRSAFVVTFACIALLCAGWLAAALGYYTPGSDFGYTLGLAGSLMMLALLGYPLRKRIRVLQALGPLKWWFRAHMVLGIGGPLLVLLHSTFRVGSLNAGVALSCMILVAGSGIVGRFLYARIHYGLYGREMSLAGLRTELDGLAAGVHSDPALAPAIVAPLDVFTARIADDSAGALKRTWRFVTAGWSARKALRRCKRRLKPALRERARREQWSRERLRRRYAETVAAIRAYLECAQRVAQYRGYERMFALWHVAHVPFVYMLVLSAIAHVVAVHMY